MKITEPTLLLNPEKCQANIERMVLKAKKHNLCFRPHFKTHQSLQIGKWFKNLGINQITVSSLKMAEYFKDDWDDITVAFPANIREMETINRLSAEVHLNLLAESLETIIQLGSKATSTLGVLIKIDVGYHRTGVDPNNISNIDQLIKHIKQFPNLNFKGFLGHAGHSYSAKTKSEIHAIHHESIRIMQKLKSNYLSDFPNIYTSLGDTPTCSIMDDFKGVDEIRPGNFVFYDLAQYKIGSCSLEQIAIAMACPVVAKHEARKELVIYGGGVHFSKDVDTMDKTNLPYYGYIANLQNGTWDITDKQSYYSKMSQEHGIIQASDTCFEQYQVGDVIGVLPIHSCMTADLYGTYQTSSGLIERL